MYVAGMTSCTKAICYVVTPAHACGPKLLFFMLAYFGVHWTNKLCSCQLQSTLRTRNCQFVHIEKADSLTLKKIRQNGFLFCFLINTVKEFEPSLIRTIQGKNEKKTSSTFGSEMIYFYRCGLSSSCQEQFLLSTARNIVFIRYSIACRGLTNKCTNTTTTSLCGAQNTA